MTDVARYCQIVGCTPAVLADGSFVTLTPEQAENSRFARFVTKVWIYQNPVPDAANELLEFDVAGLRQPLHRYEADGGVLHRDGRVGGSLYETWAAHQLFEKRRYSVLLKESSAASQPIDGIPRVGLASSVELADHLIDRLPRAGEGNEADISALMDLGGFGHVIRLRSRASDGASLQYWDTWPGPSLLCDGNNHAGIRAQLASQAPIRWSLTRSEFEFAVQAVLLRTANLNGTRYGEPLIAHTALMKSEIFDRFRLRPVQRAQVDSAIESETFQTRLFNAVVQLDFAINADQYVQMAVIRTDPTLAIRTTPMIAQFAAAVTRALAGDDQAIPNSAALAPVINSAIHTSDEAKYVGSSICVDVRMVTENGESVARIEIAPA